MNSAANTSNGRERMTYGKQTTMFKTKKAQGRTRYYMTSKTHDILTGKELIGDYWEFEDWMAWTQGVRCKETGNIEIILFAADGVWEFPPKPRVKRTAYFQGDFVHEAIIKPKYDCMRFLAFTPLVELGRFENTEEGMRAIDVTMMCIQDGMPEDGERPEFLR